MPPFHDDYDFSVVGILNRALAKSLTSESIKQDVYKPFFELVNREIPPSIEEYYRVTFEGVYFSEIHRFVFTLLLTLEPRKVLAKRFENWFTMEDRPSISPTSIVHLSASERETIFVPDLVRDFLPQPGPLLYPEEIIVTNHQRISEEQVFSCLQQHFEPSDFDLWYAAGLTKVFNNRYQAKSIVSQICLDWISMSMSEMINIEMFMDIVSNICTTEPVSSMEASILLNIILQLSQTITTESEYLDDYCFLNGILLLMDLMVTIIVAPSSAIVRVFRQPASLETEKKVPLVYTMLYQTSQLGVHICECVWDKQLKTIRPLISLVRVLLSLINTLEIPNEASTVEKELKRISSTFEMVLNNHLIKLADEDERKETEIISSRLSSTLKRILRS